MKINPSTNQSLEKMKTGLSGLPGKIKKLPGRTFWIGGAAIIILAAAVGFFFWNRANQAAKSSTASINTATVKSGDITVSATGTGTLTAVLSNDLGFPVEGYLGELYVRVGDKVKKGQELAKLADLTTLEANVVAAQQDLVTAQSELDDLKISAPMVLANAQLTVADDKKALEDAKAALIHPGQARCDNDQTEAYYYQWQKAKDSLADLGDTNPSNNDYYLKVVVPAKDRVLSTYSTYIYCAGFTDYEIDASNANLAIANAQLQKDQATLDLLKEHDGLDPNDLATAENKVKNAEVSLKAAQENLDEATIKAPFDGTITAIDAQVGDKVEIGSFITIVDDTHPQISFAIDETDMSILSMDEQAEVTFDAIENKIFTGKVILINPTLQSTDGYPTVAGTIQLELASGEELPVSMQGLTATVKIIKGKSQNTLLIPVEALREISDGEYAVYLVDSSGKMTLKTVKVGLVDSVNAEILSGLNVGDKVSTGLMETKQ